MSKHKKEKKHFNINLDTLMHQIPQKQTVKMSDFFRDQQVLVDSGQYQSLKSIYSQNGMDAVNIVPQVNNQFFNKMNNLLINNINTGYAEQALLLQNPILNRICTTRADETTGKWIEFISTGEDKADKIIELEKEFERLDVKYIFNRASYNDDGFGGCLIFIKLKYDDTDEERMTELIIDDLKIAKGDLEYLKIIEPLYYVVPKFEASDPTSKYFYRPEFYTIQGQTMHASRVLHVALNEVPDVWKPTYRFNGYPLTQFCAPYVMGFETVRTEIVTIVGRYNINVLKTNLEAIVNSGMDDGNSLSNRLQMFNLLRNNMGVMALDMESEDMMQLQLSLANLDKIFSQNLELICCIAGVPASKLLGTAPQGFNSTGEHEMKNFYDTIKTRQAKLTPHLIKIMKLAMLNIWGEIDKDITFRWANLEEANELEESTIRLNTANEISSLITSGVVTPKQSAEKLMSDENSGWDGLEIMEEDFENESEEEYI